MFKRLLTIGMLVIAMVALAACETTGTSEDDTAAQALQPNIAGFTTENVDTGLNAIALAAGTSAAATGNVPLAAAIERANTMLNCLEDVGAVSGIVFTEADPDILPQTGVSLIVNKTRVRENAFACLTQQAFAQAIDLSPCAATGEFTSGGDEFWFAYVGAGSGICAAFESHFSESNTAIESLTVEGLFGF